MKSRKAEKEIEMTKKKIMMAWLGGSDEYGFNSDNKENYGAICTTLQKGLACEIILEENNSPKDVTSTHYCQKKTRIYDNVILLCSTKFGKELRKNYKSWLIENLKITEDNLPFYKSSSHHYTKNNIELIPTSVENPTDFSLIIDYSKREVERIIENFPNCELTFHVSSGSPQMTAVLLMIHKRFDVNKLIKSYYDPKSKISKVTEFEPPSRLRTMLIDQGSQGIDHKKKKEIIREDGGKMDDLIGELTEITKWSAESILLLGESGTGKELLAKHVHENSSSKKFVPVNCGAIPSMLVESELFGHTKGSFTGATKDRIGKIEQANNGVLFLDEIGEMPKDAQVKLLRALQEKKIYRVGDEGRPISVNFRLVAATNKNLIDEVDKGSFREDLFYRIDVFTYEIPSLKERGAEDIRLLSQYFMERINMESQSISKDYVAKTFSEDAISLLAQHDWPGNVRELEKTLYRAAFRHPSIGEITATDIKKSIRYRKQKRDDSNDRTQLPIQISELILPHLDRTPSTNLKQLFEDTKRTVTIMAQERYRWSNKKAGEHLGINRNDIPKW